MKIVYICYNEVIDEEVMESMKSCGTHNYTKWTRVHGKGSASGTHLGTDIWPGLNNVIMTAVDDEHSIRLLDCVRGLRAKLGAEGIKAFCWGLEEMT